MKNRQKNNSAIVAKSLKMGSFTIFALILVGAVTVIFANNITTQAESGKDALAENSDPFFEGIEEVWEDASETVEKAVPDPAVQFGFPMDDALPRVTIKYFGRKIEKGHSPVENDRFSGYHVGTDFEVTEDEMGIEMQVYAICDGPLILKKFANGYGGMMAQRCSLNSETVTVVYGHLNLETISSESGQIISKGEVIGFLGADHSEETDGVRKHLHLGVRQGTEIDIRGYVQDEVEIDQWVDPMLYMPK